MQKLLLLLALITLTFACKNTENKEADNATEETKEVSVISVLDLDEFHAKAAAYVDKEVVTKGIVDHVCKHGGKRLLIVSDNADLHIDGEERFDEDLNGSEIEVTGIVREFRVDESYCLKMEEDNIKAHNAKEVDDEQFDHKKEQIGYYRDSMKVSGIDHISYYSMDYVSHKEIK